MEHQENLQDASTRIIDTIQRNIRITMDDLQTLFKYFHGGHTLVKNITVPQDFRYENLLRSTYRIYQEMIQNPTFSRIDFCEYIDDIATKNDTYISVSIDILNRIEICALHFYDRYHKTQPLDQQEKLRYAYSARIKFYNNVFVKTQAKHNHPQWNSELLDLCDYLRHVVTQNDRDHALTRECRDEMLAMLKTVGVTRIDWSDNPKFEFKNKYEISDHNNMKKLYKAILGHKIRNNISEISKRTSPIIRAGLPEREITIRGHYNNNHLLVGAANTLLKARTWEAAAFTSCLGIIIRSDTHNFEIRLSEFIVSIDFNTIPSDFMKVIADLKSKNMLKKYLKYKNKYLNLKKQLNLL
jgi:hypothetical protein